MMMCSLSTMNAIKLFSESNFCHSCTYENFVIFRKLKMFPISAQLREDWLFWLRSSSSVECVKWKYLNERQSRFQSASLVALMMSYKINFLLLSTTSNSLGCVFIFQKFASSSRSIDNLREGGRRTSLLFVDESSKSFCYSDNAMLLSASTWHLFTSHLSLPELLCLSHGYLNCCFVIVMIVVICFKGGFFNL